MGHRFLKHLQRTGVLLHLIDIAPSDPDADPVRDARAIVAELKKFSKELVSKPRWLVINKRDLLPDEEAEARAKDIVRRLRYNGPVHLISAATGRGTRELAEAVMNFLESRTAAEAARRPMRNSKVRQRIAAGQAQAADPRSAQPGRQVRADAGRDRHLHGRRAAPPGRGARVCRTQARRSGTLVEHAVGAWPARSIRGPRARTGAKSRAASRGCRCCWRSMIWKRAAQGRADELSPVT